MATDYTDWPTDSLVRILRGCFHGVEQSAIDIEAAAFEDLSRFSVKARDIVSGLAGRGIPVPDLAPAKVEKAAKSASADAIILRSRRRGKTRKRIADDLNADGIHTAYGKRWSVANVGVYGRKLAGRSGG